MLTGKPTSSIKTVDRALVTCPVLLSHYAFGSKCIKISKNSLPVSTSPSCSSFPLSTKLSLLPVLSGRPPPPRPLPLGRGSLGATVWSVCGQRLSACLYIQHRLHPPPLSLPRICWPGTLIFSSATILSSWLCSDACHWLIRLQLPFVVEPWGRGIPTYW